MDLFLMSHRDTQRLNAVQDASEGRITNREGAEAVGVSLRQFKRMRRRFREEGVAGLGHRSRGRPSARRVATSIRERVLELLSGKIKFNDHHIADLLVEEDQGVSATTVWRLRLELKLPAKRRRRPPRHRRRRLRKARCGEMVLIDGSPCHWYDDSQPPCTLLGAIDDAT